MILHSMGECKVINEKILSEDIANSVSQEILKYFENSELKKRAFVNYSLPIIAKRYFDSINEELDIESGLHNIPQVLQKLDISDVYWNNTYIDVRLCLHEDELLVPKEQFVSGLIPAVYMFIKAAPDFSNVSVLGFIETGTIEQTEAITGFYSVKKEELADFETIKSNISANNDNYEIDDVELYNYNTENDNSLFYLKLLNSYSGRVKFNKILKAQNVFQFISPNESEQSAHVENLQVTDEENDDLQTEFKNFTTVTPNLQFETKYATNENTAENIEVFEPEKINQEDASKMIESEVVEDKTIEAFYSDSTNDDGQFVDEGFDIESVRKAQNRPKKLIIAGVITLLAVILGVLGFLKIKSGSNELPANLPTAMSTDTQNNNSVQEAMPVESVNQNIEPNQATEEGNAVSIPSIENNLDASILVSNLKIDWEVPSSYASNTSITRYLIKLGKIIQLNLKAELLLLSRPPITNRITVELQFNKDLNKFDAVGIVNSSGEKSVDDIIMQTIKKSLKVKINANTDSFAKLEGNPILVIKL